MPWTGLSRGRAPPATCNGPCPCPSGGSCWCRSRSTSSRRPTRTRGRSLALPVTPRRRWSRSSTTSTARVVAAAAQPAVRGDPAPVRPRPRLRGLPGRRTRLRARAQQPDDDAGAAPQAGGRRGGPPGVVRVHQLPAQQALRRRRRRLGCPRTRSPTSTSTSRPTPSTSRSPSRTCWALTSVTIPTMPRSPALESRRAQLLDNEIAPSAARLLARRQAVPARAGCGERTSRSSRATAGRSWSGVRARGPTTTAPAIRSCVRWSRCGRCGGSPRSVPGATGPTSCCARRRPGRPRTRLVSRSYAAGRRRAARAAREGAAGRAGRKARHGASAPGCFSVRWKIHRSIAAM
jgi:hypothetical protein